jgi:hypothetical protein
VESALRPAQLIWAACLLYCTGMLVLARPVQMCQVSASLEMLAAADILTLFLRILADLQGPIAQLLEL